MNKEVSTLKKWYRKNKSQFIYLAMVIPGVIWAILFFYIPVFGNVIAFKDFRFHPDGFFASIIHSEWVGFDNFKFLFATKDAYLITRNTILYNASFVILGLITAVTVAIVMSMLRSRKRIKRFQTMMLFPHFLSWVIISFFVYSFLSPDKGAVNMLLGKVGIEPINWYNAPKYWPFILLFIGTWKRIGYDSVVYFAAIMGIDPTYYEAAIVDGANKWQQIRHVTIPQLLPLVSILMILAVGNIFRADFGLFYQVPRGSGTLYNVTMVLDTYVYQGLRASGDLGMSTAAGLYQSTVGTVLLLSTNAIVRKLDPESSLF